MATAAEHAKAFKQRMSDQGLVQCNVWIPQAAVADFQRAAEMIRDDRTLSIGRMVSRVHGRLCSLAKKAPKP
jgi:hypothetical protein